MSQPDNISRGLTVQQRQHRNNEEGRYRKPPSNPHYKGPAQIPSREEVYAGNYPKSRKLAIDRSGGKCQFCGLRKASEGHHWAWPDYPSGETVQHHDLTALCISCHELATVLRDWAGRKGANFHDLELDLSDAKNFFEKREIFSYWLFPEEDEKASRSTVSQSTKARTITKPAAEYNLKHPRPKPFPQQPDEKGWPAWFAWPFWIIIGIVIFLFIVNG